MSILKRLVDAKDELRDSLIILSDPAKRHADSFPALEKCVNAALAHIVYSIEILKLSSLANLAEARSALIKEVRELKDYAVHEGHTCFFCDMGAAGPGPEGEHDPDCKMKKIQEKIKAFDDAVSRSA